MEGGANAVYMLQSFFKKKISRYNICEVINVKNKIDPKASINEYHFLAIPKWQFGELNHSKKKRRKNVKSENIQKTKCPPFPSHDMSGRLKWTVKTKLAMLQKKTTQSLFVNAAKMSSALKLKAAYVVASVKKKQYNISNSNIDQAHVEFLFGKGRPINAQKEMNSVQNHSYTQCRCLTQRNPFNGSL